MKKCVDHFVLSLIQGDVRNRTMKVSELLKSLKWYGLTKGRYYQLKKARFTPNSIKNTTQNKQQISRMAKACGHDPLPILDAVMEKV
jgi:hypothetical protein